MFFLYLKNAKITNTTHAGRAMQIQQLDAKVLSLSKKISATDYLL